MRPKSQESSSQTDLFAIRLAALLDQRHELYRLADLIDWSILDQEFGEFFASETGAPALGARSFPGNPYDGHILYSCLEQAEILSGIKAEEAFVDHGYRCVDVPGVTIYKARQKRGVNTRRLKRALKRRNAIEPIIGHLKNGGLLRRCHLKGTLEDAMHAILCGAGHNIRLILRQLRIFWPELWRMLCRFWIPLRGEQTLLSA